MSCGTGKLSLDAGGRVTTTPSPSKDQPERTGHPPFRPPPPKSAAQGLFSGEAGEVCLLPEGSIDFVNIWWNINNNSDSNCLVNVG